MAKGELDPILRSFMAALSRSGIPPVGQATVAEARARAATLAQRADHGPEVDEIFNLEINRRDGGTIPGRLLRSGGADAPLIVLLHGDGWTTGTLDEYEPLARAVSAALPCSVLLVAYRLAPEHRFPAALEDSIDAVEWAARTVAAGRKLVVMGDSAGGNLAAALCQIARDRGTPRIDAQVLVYPITDGAERAPSHAEFADGPLLTTGAVEWHWDQYLPDRAERRRPAASPLRGRLHGLPPAYVLTVRHDPLRDEGEAYARALREAGVRVVAERRDDMAHGFLTMLGLVDQAQEAVERIARVLPELLSAAPAAGPDRSTLLIVDVEADRPE